MKQSFSSIEKYQPRLLVVDDDADFLALLANFLKRMGYHYDTAEDGEKALQKLLTFSYSLVLTDMQMPKLNGLQLIAEVKKRLPETDIIVMTGYGHSYGPAESIGAGAIDYITKPFTKEELEAKLKRVFRERQLVGAFRNAMNTLKEEEVGLRQSLQELETKLKEQSFELNETHTALRVMLRQRAQDQREFKADFSDRIMNEVLPHLEKLNRTQLTETQKNLIALVNMHLGILSSAEGRDSALGHYPLTPTEYRVANLIKQGKASKEIAALLNISVGTVRSHRANLRKKLRITNQKKNLYKTLLSIP